MNIKILPFYLLFIGFYQIANASSTKQIQKFRQPKPEHVLRQIQTANEQFLPRLIKVSTWNIQKSQNANNISDLNKIIKEHHLTLIQEITDEPKLIDSLRNDNQLNMNYAASFYINGTNITTGVMTLSTASPSWLQYRRSPGRETLVNTPKLTLIEEYLFTQNDRLLVLNIHGLNFVNDDTFKGQINDLTPLLKQYKFRILFAGDFNTWNPNRLRWLKQRLSEYQVNQASIVDDQRIQPLDHFFIRGCQIIEAKAFNHIKSSDHRPLSMQLNCQ